MGTHRRNISAAEFADHCHRQNHLIIDEWRVLRFAHSDVQNFERNCQQTLQQLIGRLALSPHQSLGELAAIASEIMRLAAGLRRAIVTTDVTEHVNGAMRTIAPISIRNLLQIGISHLQ